MKCLGGTVGGGGGLFLPSLQTGGDPPEAARGSSSCCCSAGIDFVHLPTHPLLLPTRPCLQTRQQQHAAHLRPVNHPDSLEFVDERQIAGEREVRGDRGGVG